ncbi:transglutaminase domain-containing protein [Paenibacillaceae bacterium WGS1546]|uniref:transglutaminase domain-containing protein n=1 Tax=Cohnella sp. WGS1546 TaxID=3366810 RepID=UPI00372D77A0
MRKRLAIGFLVAVLVVVAAIPAAASANAAALRAALDTSEIRQGTIGIRIDQGTTRLVRATIARGEEKYTYAIDAKEKSTVWLPLQLGNGNYEVSLFENVTGNKYRVALAQKVRVHVAKAQDVYLNSVQLIDWREADKAAEKAKKLTREAKTDEQKAKAIYDYIVGNVQYDKKLAASVTSDYVPDIDGTLESGKAICYGYATLYAAMLRSVGIPAKLAMGSTKLVDEYHAWNEVYLNGKWVIVDTTVDAGLSKGDKKPSFAKKPGDYEAVKYY